MARFKTQEEFAYDPNDVFGHMQQEFPQESEFDVAIIGAGTNGLMAGAYLAKAGRKVLVLERRHIIGGATVSEEIHPGFTFSSCS